MMVTVLEPTLGGYVCVPFANKGMVNSDQLVSRKCDGEMTGSRREGGIKGIRGRAKRIISWTGSIALGSVMSRDFLCSAKSIV